jgi:hypothetical protein
MQEIATRKEKALLLKNRARRLAFFIMEFNGRQNPAIQREAYLILEAFENRPRAIWRYIRFAFREWRTGWRFRLQFGALFFWYTRVRGLEREAAMDRAHDAVEGRIFR